ncbi:MAG: ATP synthase F1 subunit epsilon [Deltaproteobacteria bacterium]|nr:ATP synthase F1 subunit epsilon [Deltaproteobacteria bacterium]MBN2672944.1 ATP synthase F1 subunit epsilon [Deltaproteobacteria bacterium]
MTADVRLKVVTPSGPVIDETVRSITACSEVGEFCVLPEHRPILASLKAGRLMFERDGETKVFATDAGFFEGGPDHVHVMTQHCVAKEDVISDEVQTQLAELQQKLNSLSEDSAERLPVEASIAWCEAQIRIVSEP